eukprot:2550108-Amphidinium_carterae.2
MMKKQFKMLPDVDCFGRYMQAPQRMLSTSLCLKCTIADLSKLVFVRLAQENSSFDNFERSKGVKHTKEFPQKWKSPNDPKVLDISRKCEEQTVKSIVYEHLILSIVDKFCFE